jgi:hypothetical protein
VRFKKSQKKIYWNISLLVIRLPLPSLSLTHPQDHETLQLWSEGKEAQWPKPPELRFEIGTRVDCRIGPHPVRDWVPGAITQIFYREENWPPGMCAPYQVQLDDGRLIFAPRDIDEVVRVSQIGV